MVHGKIYEGFVQALNASNNTHVVQVEGDTISSCRSALGFCFGQLGVVTSSLIPQGTRVLLVYGPIPYIIGTIPAAPPDGDSFAGRSATGTGIKGLKVAGSKIQNNDPPNNSDPGDLFEGELEIGQLQAGFIRFMTFMASLGSNDRCQVQFHLFRDLVRMISGNFEHFSSLGDEVIMDDGRVTMEFNASPYPHERLGLKEEGEPLEQPADKFDGEEFDPLITGRWRYTKMLGFLGNMFNEWFSDPAETVGRMAEDALRSGRSRVHHGPQGEVLIQGTGEIAIERRHRIPVPIRIKHSEDPKGVLREQFLELDKKFLDDWPDAAGENSHHATLLLRDYARWMSEYHSLARILQMEAKAGEFYVPSENETPAPKSNADEPDRPESYYRSAYATIRIMRDGSIMSLDAYQNNWISGPQGISVDTPMHFRAIVAGDMSWLVGGSFFLRAKRHIEMVSDIGSFLVKARTGLRFLVEKGTMFFNSEMDPDDDYSPEEGGPEAEVDAEGYGMVISSPNSSVFLEGGKNLKIRQKGRGEEEKFSLEADGETRISFRKNVDLEARNLQVRIRNLFFVGGRILGKQVSRIAFDKMFVASWGMLRVSTIASRFVSSVNGFMGGPSRYVSKNEDLDPPDLEMDEETPGEIEAPEDSAIKWRFHDPSEYLNQRVPDSIGAAGYPSDSYNLFEPLGQQYLRLDSQPDSYDTWNFENLLSGKRVDTKNEFFPPSSIEWKAADPAHETPLFEPSSIKPADMSSLTEGSLGFRKVEIKALKRNES